ncbi:MBL fold metallo-hydrolase [Prochlorococcus sp. MIT 1307]|uniref:MBL fold metallo-hydrolase n=1 Tax=Prochlorococcus sp. MIT 1307 TaxID=3096219 RepID=UPI002A747E8D|nr:MBL fold metallo-hydrolase [Prochlorococcus sp. MIT 1307]
MTFSALYFGSSGWLIEFGNFRVLIDPWLTGTLKFPPGAWLIEGSLPNEIKIPEQIDLLLLTQGLADHSHKPTLKKLPRSLPVVGSPSAANVARSCDFEIVQELKPGETSQIKELKIEAFAGAPVPNVENGYVISHPMGSLYVEPHGFMDKNIKPRQLDAVISPVVDVTLPFAGAFLKGQTVLPELIDRFQPLSVLASTTGGNAKFTGLLSSLMKMEGSTEEAAKSLDKKTLLIDPIPEKKYLLKTHS